MADGALARKMTTFRMRNWMAGTACGLVLAVSACTPVVKSHGYVPQPEALAEIVPGQDTRGSVERKIGRPGMSGVFSKDGWFYVGTTVEHLTYHEPKVVDREIVAIAFNEQDLVVSVNRYGFEDGKVIDLVTRKTPTHGRELTALQQILGNLGIFSTENFLLDQ